MSTDSFLMSIGFDVNDKAFSTATQDYSEGVTLLGRCDVSEEKAKEFLDEAKETGFCQSKIINPRTKDEYISVIVKLDSTL